MTKRRLKRELQRMLDELESSSLEVTLAPQRWPTNVGGMIRVVCNKNALWYRQYCARFLSGRIRLRRKPDTKIKRRDTARVLARLIAGIPTASSYAPVLAGIASGRLTHRRQDSSPTLPSRCGQD